MSEKPVVDTTDIAIIVLVGVLTIVYFYNRNKASNKRTGLPKLTVAKSPASATTPKRTGLENLSKASLLDAINSIGGESRLIVFYGSQTGTAEDLASRIAKEVSKSLRIATLVCDTDEYNMTEIAEVHSINARILCGFFMATYGEGEPTDNSADFYAWLMQGKGTGGDEGDEEDELTEKRPLEGLDYFIFGLGNKTYEHYNVISKRLDARLKMLGGERLLATGEGDDDGSLEEDFLAWKPLAIEAIASYFGVESSGSTRDQPHVPEFVVKLTDDDPDVVFHGEHSASDPRRWKTVDGSVVEEAPRGYDLKHPFYGRLVDSKQLFVKTADKFDFASQSPEIPFKSSGSVTVAGSTVSIERHCFHMEIDLSESGILYQSGDHLGIWPESETGEVRRLAALLKVKSLDQVVDIVSAGEAVSPKTKRPFPVPATIRAILTNYVDISDVVKQHHFEILGKYAMDAKEKARLFEICDKRDVYNSVVDKARKNLADVLQDFKSIEIPLGVVFCELLPKTGLRYYSISSSSVKDTKKVSITAVVVRYAVAAGSAAPNPPKKPKVVVKEGLATSWLERLHEKRLKLSSQPIVPAKFAVPDLHLPLYIRSSNFKLPLDPSVPIVMVGPGTGVAPFRAFIHERMATASSGKRVGSTWLFYGCRNKENDYLYRNEFEEFERNVQTESLDIDLRIITAFSRDGPQKVYVQHRIAEFKKDIWRLLEQENGCFYICGDAKHMAADVSKALEGIASELGKVNGKEWLKKLRAASRYSEDVWS